MEHAKYELFSWHYRTFSKWHHGLRVLYCWQKEHCGVCILCVTGDSSTMPVSCSAVNCVNRLQKTSRIGFYIFPVDSERKQHCAWAISRDWWEPKVTDRLCGEHFISGRPSKNPEDINYVPTVFKDRKKQSGILAVDEERQNRTAKRARQCK